QPCARGLHASATARPSCDARQKRCRRRTSLLAFRAPGQVRTLVLELLFFVAISGRTSADTFPGIAHPCRNFRTDKCGHLSWNCSSLPQFPDGKVRTLFLELLFSSQFPDGQVRTLVLELLFSSQFPDGQVRTLFL